MSKPFRYDWYPKEAHTDFTQMKAEEIGLLMQIINLIYIKGGPIDNDPKWISQSIYEMGSAKCRRIINQLIEKDALFINDENKITQKMAEKQIKNVQNRREFHSKIGKKGNEIKAQIKENQSLKSSDANARTSTSTSNNPPYSPPQGDGVPKNGNGENSSKFNIENTITDRGLKDAKDAAPGWDIYYLMRTYNAGIHDGTREPPRAPEKAFPAWCKRYTKGKSP